ncbi:TPA: hypothetical protein ACOEMP_002299 [Enterobacter hormaechei subsp. hoffmannii]|nr:hypothetical protein [Enterobacter hormaechei]
MQSIVQKAARTFIIVGAIIFSITACDQVKRSQQEIAYVDLAIVLKDSVVGKLEAEHMQKVKERLLSASKDAEAHYDSMPEEQRNKSRQADAIVINRQWQAELLHARTASVKSIKDAVEAYRQKNKITLVLDRQQIVATSGEADISQDIIHQLSSARVDYGELPKISVGKENVTESESDTKEQAQ